MSIYTPGHDWHLLFLRLFFFQGLHRATLSMSQNNVHAASACNPIRLRKPCTLLASISLTDSRHCTALCSSHQH